MMRYLGALRGGGLLSCAGEPIGRADYELDCYLIKPGEVAASGELRMTAEALNQAFGRRDLQLLTDEGRALTVRFTGKRLNAASAAAHVDVAGDLPGAKQWPRS
jgi:hypothetical protein